MASTLPWRLVNVCARLLRRLGGLRWPSWCPKAPKRCDECARFRWCDGGDENSVHRLRTALKIVGNGRLGHCRGCAIAGWCWSGGWLLTNWVLEMGYFRHRRSRFEVIQHVRSKGKTLFDGKWLKNFRPSKQLQVRNFGPTSEPILAMKYLRQHSRTYDQMKAELLSFSNPSSFWDKS